MTRADTRRARSSTAAGPAPGTENGIRFRAGHELREARERLGWDLGEVAAALRIKLAYLHALEEGRLEALPGNAYALGFLRTYATTLGLDADDVARRFRAEARDVNRPTELAFPAPVPERGVPTGAMVLLGLVVVVIGYIGWYRHSDHEQTAAHTVPPVPEQLLAAPRAAPVSPQVASVLPPPGAAPVVPPATLATPAAPPAASPAKPSAPTPPTQAAPAAPAVVTTTTQPAPPPAATSASAAPAQPAEAGLVLHATAVTWVQVRASTGHVAWDHVMQPGDSWPVPPGQTDLVLTTGNAGGLHVSDNGVPLGDLGRDGAVRRDVALTEAGLKAAIGPAASAASAPTATIPTSATSTGPAPTTPTQPTTTTPAAEPAAPAHRHHPRPAAPVNADISADDLNARQLGQHPH